MAEPKKLTNQQRRRGLEYANNLAQLAPNAPDSFARRRVYRAIGEMRRFYGFSDEEKKAEIVALLKDGCSSYSDLVSEMKIRRVEILKLVRELEKDGVVKIEQMSIGTGGRPSHFISLKRS